MSDITKKRKLNDESAVAVDSENGHGHSHGEHSHSHGHSHGDASHSHNHGGSSEGGDLVKFNAAKNGAAKVIFSVHATNSVFSLRTHTYLIIYYQFVVLGICGY